MRSSTSLNVDLALSGRSSTVSPFLVSSATLSPFLFDTRLFGRSLTFPPLLDQPAVLLQTCRGRRCGKVSALQAESPSVQTQVAADVRLGDELPLGNPEIPH